MRRDEGLKGWRSFITSRTGVAKEIDNNKKKRTVGELESGGEVRGGG